MVHAGLLVVLHHLFHQVHASVVSFLAMSSYVCAKGKDTDIYLRAWVLLDRASFEKSEHLALLNDLAH
jgi:hypothetical protein